MNHTASKAASAGKAGQSHISAPASNPSLLLDKLSVRRSTPDSEALASSDDELELHRQDSQQSTVVLQKPTRRASWLNDTSQAVAPRKNSFASSSMSPTASHPSTPAAEAGTWSSGLPAASAGGLTRPHPAPPSLTWGTGIWNNDSRKDPPSRLTEVLPSPTSLYPPGSNGSFFGSDGGSQPSLLSRDHQQNPTLPFAIPLHPTPKTYRSQSYSVGQLDPDTPTVGAGPPGSSAFSGRARPSQHSGLQHRPSRPSMLSEMTNDSGQLEKLKEIDDDDDNAHESPTAPAQQQSAEAKTIEMLARENAMLRQQQYNNSRLRPRNASVSSSLYPTGNGYGIPGLLPEESDYAIDELDEIAELHENANKGMLGRRLSEWGPGQGAKLAAYMSVQDRKLESVRKPYWQSSLGFGGLADIPQSRRHSFADIPTRQGSVSSIGEPVAASSGIQESVAGKENNTRYQDGAAYPMNDHAAAYFGGGAVLNRQPDAYGAAFPQSAYPSYPSNPAFDVGRATSPHHSMYGMAQPRQTQLLYLVLFKCSRADVFYVQEGTGLTVKPGDLVIVEADRGTDLGTVAEDKIDWVHAKELKEQYAEEHYKWLMMYSQTSAGTADGTGAGLMAASNGLQGSAIGGMGPPTQHGMQDPNPGELKPKVIKRLAQSHEIQALRDKEGNEAKAKRVCMQKVKEHGLHMEILDAEFQMDFKKLTFYYYAQSYVNFNPLVTDLFRVYKTRIWMSAINPASFASPGIGLQAPSGIGPGAVGVTRNSHGERRQTPNRDQSDYGGLTQTPLAYPGGYGPLATAPDRAGNPSSYPSHSFPYGYSPFAAAPRSAAMPVSGYPPSMIQQIDHFTGFMSPGDYQSGLGRFPSPQSSGLSRETGEYGRQEPASTRGGGWVSSFQGLSLNAP